MTLLELKIELTKVLPYLERIASALERAYPDPMAGLKTHKPKGPETLSWMGHRTKTQIQNAEAEEYLQYGPRNNYPEN